jgi:hypothetical protein
LSSPRPPAKGLARIGLRHLFIGAILLVALIPASGAVADPDFFWHLQVGRWILDHNAIPTHDLFTYTVSDHRFVAHEWLSEVIMAAITAVVGLGGVSLYFTAITWAAFVGLLRTARAGYLIAGLGLAVGFAAGNPIWGPRTQMITFAFSVALLLLLRRYRETHDRRWLYPIPPLFLLWVNLHAGFTIGLVFLVIALIGEVLRNRLLHPTDDGSGGGPVPIRPLLAVIGLSALAVLVNPNFAGIYLYAVQTQFSTAQQRLIVEWFSPNFHQPEIRAFEGMLLLLICLIALSPRRPRLTDMLLLLAGLTLALQSVRHIALFVAIATPIMIELGQATWDGYRDHLPRLREPRPNAVMGAINLVVLVAIGALALGTHVIPDIRSGFRSKAITSSFPVAAVDFVAADLPPGHVLNQYGWGGYLVYRIWPRQQVYIYGDAAVMGDAFLNEYEDVNVIRPDYRQVLDRRGVTWVIYPTADPLEVVLEQSSDWQLVHQDKVASVLVRKIDATQTYLARHARL